MNYYWHSIVFWRFLAGLMAAGLVVALLVLPSDSPLEPASSDRSTGDAGSNAASGATPSPTAVVTLVGDDDGLLANTEPTATPESTATPEPTSTPERTLPTVLAEALESLTPVGDAPVDQPDQSGATPTAEAVQPGDLDPDDVQALIAATRDEDWSVRWEAVNALGVLGDPAALESLVERALVDVNSHPRWRSLWAISTIDPDGTEAILALTPGLDDADPEVVRNAAVAIAFFSGASAIPELIEGLSDTDEFRRWEAVFSLRNFQDEAVTDGLIPLLSASAEPAVRVRNEVALSLGGIDDDRVAPALFEALRNDPSPEVRWRAAMTLGRNVGPESLDDLRAALADEMDDRVRQFIEDAIADVSGA